MRILNIVKAVIFSNITIYNTCAIETVNMSNIASQMPIYYDIYGNTTANTPIYAQILYHIYDGAPWALVVSVSTGSSIMTVDESGYFDGGVGTVPWATDNSLVSFYVRAWSGTPDYDSSIQLGKNGISTIWQQNTGSWDQSSGLEPTGPALEMSSHVLVQVQPMPEPSTIALFILASPLLVTLFRKQQNS
jgi:hypothetical protein